MKSVGGIRGKREKLKKNLENSNLVHHKYNIMRALRFEIETACMVGLTQCASHRTAESAKYKLRKIGISLIFTVFKNSDYMKSEILGCQTYTNWS